MKRITQSRMQKGKCLLIAMIFCNVSLLGEGEITRQLIQYEKQIDITTSGLTGLKTKLKPQEESLRKMQEQLRSYLVEKNKHKKTVDGLKAFVEGVKKMVQTLGPALQSVQTAYNATKSFFDEKINAILTEITQAQQGDQNRLNAAQAEVDKAQEKVDGIQRDIDDLQSQIENEERRYDGLDWIQKGIQGPGSLAKRAGWRTAQGGLYAALGTAKDTLSTAHGILEKIKQGVRVISPDADPRVIGLKAARGTALGSIQSSIDAITSAGKDALKTIEDTYAQQSGALNKVFSDAETLFASIDTLLQKPISGLGNLREKLDAQLTLIENVNSSLRETKEQITQARKLITPPPPPKENEFDLGF